MAVSNLVINQGNTFANVVRWETLPIVYKAISAIANTAPVSINAIAHGLVDGWRVAIQSVKGMSQVNAVGDTPRASDFHVVSVVDADTIELNDVNAAGFGAYVSGGYLRFYTPVDLTGFTARMSVKDKIGGTELLRLDTSNGRITIDNTAKTISLFIDADDSELITWAKGVYDLEMVSALGIITTILSGSVVVIKEVTSP